MRQGLACLLLALPAAAIADAKIHVEPASTVLDGEPVHLVVTGAPSNRELTVTAERWFAPAAARKAAARLMRSEATFLADGEGRVDTRAAKPLRGTYRDADARGLFWSMQGVAGVERAPPGSVDTSEVRLQLRYDGGESRTALRLQPSLPAVRTIAAEGLPGAVFSTLPGERKRPALILIGGSEGGSGIGEAAPAFASHGFAVLALPVFSPPDRSGQREIPELPAAWADMPIETLDKARDWLASRPEVDASRIGVHGTSMGSVLALLAGVHRPWVKAVVASVPSDVVWDGWGPGIEHGTRSTFSLEGKPLPFVSPVGYDDEVKGFERNEPVIIRRAFERGRAARPDLAAKARVPVERIRVPVMVIGAYDDQMWPSGMMAQGIAERRMEAGLETEALLYPDAGHLLYDTGYAPTTGYNLGLRKTGGTPQANARAQADAWPRTIRFLQRTLSAKPE
jgi:dienelactone hydrolase